MGKQFVLPLKHLPAWLMSINPEDVKKPEMKAMLIEYHGRSRKAMNTFFKTGIAMQSESDKKFIENFYRILLKGAIL